MDEHYITILHEREKLLNIKPHMAEYRHEMIYYIIDINCAFREFLKETLNKKIELNPKKSFYYKRRYNLDFPTMEIVQLSIMYMDIYITHMNKINKCPEKEKDVSLACYILAYKYENDAHFWRIIDFIVIKGIYGGQIGVNRAIKLELYLLQEVLNFRANIPTPLAFIDEYGYDSDGTNKENYKTLVDLSTKILISTDYYDSPSKIAKLCISLLDTNTINRSKILGIVDESWDQFSKKYTSLHD